MTSAVAELSRSSCEPTLFFTSDDLALDVALLQLDALLRKVEHLAVDLDVGDEIVVG